MQNKKAIEPIIATVLLIVITIAAVALIIAFVVPFVQNQLSTANLCLKAQGIQIDPTATCYKPSQEVPGQTDIIVKVDWSGQTEKFTLNAIRVSISNGTTTVSDAFADLPANPGESRTQKFVKAINGTITQVSIAPVIDAGKGKLITCDIRSIAPARC